MIFDNFPYIAMPDLIGGVDDGVKRILCVNGKKDTYTRLRRGKGECRYCSSV